jgi:carbonic anhydrase
MQPCPCLWGHRCAALGTQNIPAYGYIYDVKTGKLIEVPEATKAGKAA